jgi:competence protein ComEA
MSRRLAVALAVLALSVMPLAAQQTNERHPGPVKASASAPVNLNTATTEQLESLPGIGPRTAERIVEYRQKNGGFKKIEDLMNVKGVGEKGFLKLKALVTVTPAKGDRSGQQ